MRSRARLASVLTVLTVTAIAAAAALIGAAGPAPTIAGTPGRAAPVQVVPVQSLAGLKQTPAQTNALFTPITPCRAVDTRATIGRIAAGSTYGFKIRGTNLASQGGAAGGCGVPASATAVAVSVSSVNIAGTGYVRIWPYGQADPGATIAHYQAGPITTTGGTITLGTGGYDINAKAFDAAAGLVLDITGYYAPQIHGMVTPASSSDSTHDAPIFAGSSRIVSATNPQVGVYVVTFDSPIAYCSPIVDTYNAGSGIYGAAYAFSGNTATVYTWYINSTSHQEVLFSYYFYIAIIC